MNVSYLKGYMERLGDLPPPSNPPPPCCDAWPPGGRSPQSSDAPPSPGDYTQNLFFLSRLNKFKECNASSQATAWFKK